MYTNNLSSDREMIEKFSKMTPEKQVRFIDALKQEQNHVGVPIDTAIINWYQNINQLTHMHYPKQKEADFQATLSETENFIQWLRAIRSYQLPTSVTEDLQDHINALLNTPESRRFYNMVSYGDPDFWPWFFRIPLLLMTHVKSQNTCQLSWSLNRDADGQFYVVYENRQVECD